MHTQPLIPLSTVRRPPTTYRSKTTHSQLYDEGKDNRGQSQTKEETQLKPTRKFRVVLGPSMAKTTQQQPKPGYFSNHNTHYKLWQLYTVPNIISEHRSQHGGKQQSQTHNNRNHNMGKDSSPSWTTKQTEIITQTTTQSLSVMAVHKKIVGDRDRFPRWGTM